jgi:hypothetical protein
MLSLLLYLRTRRSPGQALIEAALVIPMLLILTFGVVGVGRVTHAQVAVSATAREAARAGALADDTGQAQERGRARGEEVAKGYGLTGGAFTLTVDPGSFERGGRVRASARYEVTLDDLPLLGWARVELASEHVERIDLYRSRWKNGSQG